MITCPNKQLIYGLLGCLGGLFIQLVVGSVYQWGIINIYITSYYKTIDPTLTLQTNLIAFPVMMICIGFTMRLGLMFASATHPLISMSIVVVIQAGLIFSSSYIPTFVGFIILYGVLFGLCSGLNFMTPIVQCNLYFPGKKMYVNGFILVGTGFGPLVFGVFAYNYLNPLKVPPVQGYYIGSQELQAIAKKVPQCLRWLSLLYLCIGMIGVALLSKVCLINRKKLLQQKKRKQQEQGKAGNNQLQNKDTGNNIVSRQILGQKNKNENGYQNIHQQYSPKKSQKSEEIIVNSSQNIQSQVIELKNYKVQPPKNIKEAICTKIFWNEIFIILFTGCGLYLINGNYKTYVKHFINDDQFLTTIGVIASVGNGGSRFFWNLLFNKTGFKFVMSANIIIQIIVYSIIRFTVYTRGVYMFLVFLINCCIGEMLVVTPTFSQIVFGQKLGSDVYGLFWTTYGVANFIQFGYVSGLSSKIGFDAIIYICLGMAFIALLIINFSTLEAPWEHPVDQLKYFKCCQVQEQKQEQGKRQKLGQIRK